MLRSEAALMIYPADAAIPDDLIPLISVAELSNRGKTELVEVTLTLKGSLNAEDFAPQAKRLLGDFARVTPLEATNQLIIRIPWATSYATLKRSPAGTCKAWWRKPVRGMKPR